MKVSGPQNKRSSNGRGVTSHNRTAGTGHRSPKTSLVRALEEPPAVQVPGTLSRLCTLSDTHSNVTRVSAGRSPSPVERGSQLVTACTQAGTGPEASGSPRSQLYPSRNLVRRVSTHDQVQPPRVRHASPSYVQQARAHVYTVGSGLAPEVCGARSFSPPPGSACVRACQSVPRTRAVSVSRLDSAVSCQPHAVERFEPVSHESRATGHSPIRKSCSFVDIAGSVPSVGESSVDNSTHVTINLASPPQPRRDAPIAAHAQVALLRAIERLGSPQGSIRSPSHKRHSVRACHSPGPCSPRRERDVVSAPHSAREAPAREQAQGLNHVHGHGALGQSAEGENDSLESGAVQEAWLAPSMQEARRASLIGDPNGRAARFVDACEFVGLGCYCAVSRSLQALGVKKYSYPFDWTRSPAEGIIQCLENNFAEFLTHSTYKDHGASGKCFGNSNWNGSFWHHDPTSAKSKKDFQRRIDRLFGRQEVSIDRPRVFIRAVNSTQEVAATLRLLQALRQAFPGNLHVHLLILVDNQPSPGPMRLQGRQGDGLLFYKGAETLFANNGRCWTMQRQAETYAEAVAFAVRHWAGRSDGEMKVEEMQSLAQLTASLVPFEGGDTGSALFWPRRVAKTRTASPVAKCRAASPQPLVSVSAPGARLSPSSLPSACPSACPSPMARRPSSLNRLGTPSVPVPVNRAPRSPTPSLREGHV